MFYGYRFADYWRGQAQPAAEPADERARFTAGDEGRDAGHEERGCAVQSAGDGARSVRGSGGVDTHWLGGRAGRCFMMLYGDLVMVVR